MKVGIHAEGCETVTVLHGRFHNVDRPMVFTDCGSVLADGNIATYDRSDASQPDRPKQQERRGKTFAAWPTKIFQKAGQPPLLPLLYGPLGAPIYGSPITYFAQGVIHG